MLGLCFIRMFIHQIIISIVIQVMVVKSCLKVLYTIDFSSNTNIVEL